MNPLSKAYRVSLMLIAAILLAGLAGCQPQGLVYDPQSGRWVSPLPTQISPIQTPTFEPTTPSLPTLTPLPTLPPEPTRSGTPVIKGGPTLTPSPTRPPLLLTPTPVGSPPANLQSLYYVADNNGNPELRVIGIDDQGRKWSEFESAVGEFPAPLMGLHLSPDGRYLALEFLGDGYGEVDIMERSSGRIWCPLREPAACWGGFWGWMPDNRLLFQPFDVPPEGVAPLGVIVVDPTTGEYAPLDLPIEPRWGYSLARNISPRPGSFWVAYSVTYPEGGEEVSEIWSMRMDGRDRRLVRKVKGLINALSWSPTGEQLVYNYQGESGQLPTELRLLDANGSNEKSVATHLPESGEPRFHPVWSPDGRYVAFVQLDQSITFEGTYLILAWSNVYVGDTITGQIARLSSFEQREANYPTWSPDGRFVAFMSTDKQGEETLYSELWVASADGSQLYAVSGTAKWNNALAWLQSVPATVGK